MRIEDVMDEMGSIGLSMYKPFKSRRCSSCSKYIGAWSRKGYWAVGEVDYCDNCARINFKICDCCNKIVDRIRNIDEKKICVQCYQNKTKKCAECGIRKFDSDLMDYGFRRICISCYNLVNRRFHSIDIGERKIQSKAFTKNLDKRYCGVEIECLNRHKNVNCFVSEELKDFGFSQGTDGSLSSGGVEFRSVPMNGDLLFDSIESFGEQLDKKRYRVDKTCGLHIHLEVKEDVEYLKKLYLFYLRFEDMFFNMLPKSRRSKSYCARFSRHYKDTPEQIMNVGSMDKFKEMIYETSHYGSEMRDYGNDKRYCWANLHSIFYRGTLEIRNHSGTINPSKIINWIMIHQRVLEFLKEKSLEEIGSMKVTKEAFLKIFGIPLQNYIKRRWTTFVLFEESDLKTRAPVYIKVNQFNIKNKESK